MTMNRSRLRLPALVSAALASALPASRADEEIPTYFLKADTAIGQSVHPYECRHWAAADGSGIPGASDGETIPGAADYVVRDGKSLGLEGYAGTFPGRTLAIGDERTGGSLSWDSGDLVIPRLKAVRGTMYYNIYGLDGEFLTRTFTGDIEVASSAESPFRLFFDNALYWNHEWKVVGAVTGPAGASMLFGAAPSNSTITTTGDWSGYKGDVRVGSNHPNSAVGGFGLKWRVAPNALDGAVQMEAGGVLAPIPGMAPLSIGALVMSQGSRLEVAIDLEKGESGVIVRREFSKDQGPVDVRVSAALDMHGMYAGKCFSLSHRLLSLPAETAADLGDFSVTFDENTPDYFRHWWKLTRDSAPDGSCAFSLRLAPDGTVVCQGRTWDSSDKSQGASGGDSLSNPEAWTGGQLPGEGAHCLVVDRTLRTPVRIDEDVRFDGRSICLANGQLSYFCRRIVSAAGEEPSIRTFGNSALLCGQHASVSIRSPLDVGPGKVDLQVYEGQAFVLDGEISGTGDVWIPGVTETGAPQGRVYLNGTNTQFLGSILVTNYEDVAYGGNVQKLVVSDARSLGGTLPAFNFRALELTKGSVVRFDGQEAIALSGDSNRGLFVRGDGELQANWEVPSVDVAWPITYEGVFHFRGDFERNVLCLSGVPRFGAGDAVPSDRPTPGKNVLAVEMGIAKPMAAHALDGVTVRFAAEKSKIVIPVGEMRERGLVNVKTDEPFALAPGQETLPLEVEFPAEIPESVNEIGLMTVTAEAAGWVRAHLPRIRGRGRHRRVSESLNADGTVTFKLCRSGVVAIIR